MAHVFRLKLKALRPLPSPALTSKLVDTTNIPWRCYGGNALLESCNSSATDIDGDSKAANGAGDSATKDNGAEHTVSTESNLDNLTASIYDKLRARANVAHDEKDNGFEGQLDNCWTKDTKKPDKWQKVVSNARTMALKNKLKATAAEIKLGLPKIEAEDGLSDLDIFGAEGESGDFGHINKISSDIDACIKGSKQTTTLSSREKPKDANKWSFLSLADDVTSSPQEDRKVSLFTEADHTTENLNSALKHSKSGERGLLEKASIVPDGDDSKASKSKESALPRPVQGAGPRQTLSQSRSKDTTQGMPDFKAEGSRDDLPVQKVSSSFSEVMLQPPQNDKSVPTHSSYMVCVHGLPANSNPAVIKASMSTYGEVSGFYKKSRDTTVSAYVQFKTGEGMDNAVAARKLQIGSNSFSIVRTDPVFSTVVRLSKVSADTTETQMRSVCGKYGSIDTVRKRSNGVYDVFYQVKEVSNMISILGSLNEVTFNRSKWFAIPAPTLHPAVQKNVLKTPEGQAWHDMQVHQALSRIELGIDGMSVLFEDLKELTALRKELFKR